MNDFIDYQPITEEEALGLIEKGEYDCTIKDAYQKTSQAGNNFVVLVVTVKNKDLTLWCTLPHLLKHVAEATGNENKYKSKELKFSDLKGKKCIAKVNIKPGTDQYPNPKNVITDFKKLDSSIDDLPFDDQVPF